MNNPDTEDLDDAEFLDAEVLLVEGIRYGLGIGIATIEAVIRAEGDTTGTLTRVVDGLRAASMGIAPRGAGPNPTEESPANT